MGAIKRINWTGERGLLKRKVNPAGTSSWRFEDLAPKPSKRELKRDGPYKQSSWRGSFLARTRQRVPNSK